MKFSAVAAFTMFAAISSLAHAQETLSGKYQGFITVQTAAGSRNLGVVMNLQSSESGAVTGTGTINDGPCADDFPLGGTFKEGELRVGSRKKGGRGGDCGFTFSGKLEGNKLVGRLGSYDLELRK